MTAQELKDTVSKLKGYNVVDVDFTVNTFTTDKKCVYAFELTKKGLLKTVNGHGSTVIKGFLSSFG